jgi:predicted chitinase
MRAHEFLDQNQLNEDMSRRGFLGALGAGALASAGVNARTQYKPEQTKPIETVNISMNTGPEDLLQRTAIKSGIRGNELAQFMAQTKHESADFSRMKEIGGSQYFAQRYDPKSSPKTAKILGNTKPGDGVKYHGRGYIQITGRDNYRMAGQALGLPLEQHPEMAAKPDVAAKIAVWYWKTRVKPNVANFNDTTAVTKLINPAMRGLKDRFENFKQYKLVMNV